MTKKSLKSKTREGRMQKTTAAVKRAQRKEATSDFDEVEIVLNVYSKTDVPHLDRGGELRVQENVTEMVKFDGPINPASVQAALAKIAPVFAYYSELKDTLEEYYEEIQLRYDLWHAEVYDEVLRRPDIGKSTEVMKEKFIRNHYSVEYKEWNDSLRKAGSAVRRAKSLLKAIEMKKDILQSIGAIMRQEMSSQI